MHRRVRLPVPAHRAPDAFRLAPRLRHRGAGREADRAVLREGLGQGAGRHLHAGGARQEDQPEGGRGLRRDLGPQPLSRRSRRAGRFRWSASSMRSASATSARPRRWRSPAATAPGRRSTTPASRSPPATRRPRPEMDALDQIGETVIEAIADLFRRDAQPQAGRAAGRAGHHPRRREAEDRHAGRRQDRGVHRLAGEDDPRRGQGDGRAARRQGRRARCRRRPIIWSPAPAPAPSSPRRKKHGVAVLTEDDWFKLVGT